MSFEVLIAPLVESPGSVLEVSSEVARFSCCDVIGKEGVRGGGRGGGAEGGHSAAAATTTAAAAHDVSE